MLYDAEQFLEDLFKPVDKLLTGPAIVPDVLPPDWHLQWDERAAILESDGGVLRERAEALALLDVLEQMRRNAELRN
ncbi:MAG TPA: hypothetical protein VH120_20160 [Gemmataceae bacterium]|jgi:hypothetical protein|nr:hypothetical protein [Gemmataceae bacterium]